MMDVIWLSIAVLILVFILHYVTIYRKVKEIDEMFPGPTSYPFIGSAVEVALRILDLYSYFEDMCFYYRRSFRIWISIRPYICLMEPRDIEKVWSSTENLEKMRGYNFFDDWLGTGLLTSFGDKWRKHRKILTPAFHFSILENFLEVFHRNGKILIEKIDEKVGGPTFDCYQIIKLYALDNICECAMGTQVNAQVNPDGNYVKAVKNLCHAVLSRALKPWLWSDFIFRLTRMGKEHVQALQIVHSFTNSVIKSRMEELQDVKDGEAADSGLNLKRRRVFLDTLILSKDGGGLTTQEIREEVDTFMFEGHDTITSAISFGLYLLSQNKHYQDRVYKEIIDLLGEDTNHVPTIQEYNSLKFLEMVIKEVMRLYPSVPFMGRRVSQDVRLDERAVIPKGTDVICLVAAMHRHIFYWEKPYEFYPEHFELEKVAARNPFLYLPFSAGPRNCIGMRFAMLEMKSSFCSLLRNFEFLPADPPAPPQLVVNVILISKNGMNIRVRRRLNNSNS